MTYIGIAYLTILGSIITFTLYQLHLTSLALDEYEHELELFRQTVNRTNGYTDNRELWTKGRQALNMPTDDQAWSDYQNSPSWI